MGTDLPWKPFLLVPFLSSVPGASYLCPHGFWFGIGCPVAASLSPSGFTF